MTIAASHLTLDPNALPWRADDLDAGFYMGRGNDGRPLLLVAPGAGNAVVPHVRYAARLVLTLADGMVAKDLGQFVVTPDRFIVMLIRGSAGQVRLDAMAGSVYVFSASPDDLQPAEARRNWRGALTAAVIRSRDGQSELQVSSVIGNLGDDGRMTYGTSLTDLLRSLASYSFPR